MASRPVFLTPNLPPYAKPPMGSGVGLWPLGRWRGVYAPHGAHAPTERASALVWHDGKEEA